MRIHNIQIVITFWIEKCSKQMQNGKIQMTSKQKKKIKKKICVWNALQLHEIYSLAYTINTHTQLTQVNVLQA